MPFGLNGIVDYRRAPERVGLDAWAYVRAAVDLVPRLELPRGIDVFRPLMDAARATQRRVGGGPLTRREAAERHEGYVVAIRELGRYHDLVYVVASLEALAAERIYVMDVRSGNIGFTYDADPRFVIFDANLLAAPAEWFVKTGQPRFFP